MIEPQKRNADLGYRGQLSWRLGTFLSYLGPPDTGQSVSLDSKGARPVLLGGRGGAAMGPSQDMLGASACWQALGEKFIFV